MGTTILIVIGMIVIFCFIGSSQNTDKPTTYKRKPTSNYKDWIKKQKEDAKEIEVPTVSSLVKNVKTLDDIKALDIESNKWLDKFQNTNYEISKYERLYKAYEDAYCKAHELIFYYQYIPELELTSSNKIIKNAYTVVSVNEYKEKKKEIGGRADDWIEITSHELIDNKLENAVEQKPDYWDSLIKYRQIVESEASYSEKKNMINELTALDKKFTDEFFLLDDNETAGEFWIKELIKSFGVPLVDKLYEMGFDSPDKFIDLDMEVIGNTKGFGPKKIEQLENAIMKIKKQHARPHRFVHAR